LWKNTYAATNHSEYWAEGVQSWFDDNAPPDALHNDIRTRAKLKEYDPTLAKLCQEVFGDGAWRYLRPAERKAEERMHLPGYDPKHLPQFGWREAPLGAKPKATIQTAVGDFDVELDAEAAPQAAALFLKLALDGGYHSGRFHDPVRYPNVKEKGFIRASINPVWYERTAPRLKLPEVPATKAPPADGTIALVRGSTPPGTFVIFVGAPTEAVDDLVPFGRVVRGADVVRKLLVEAAESDKPNPTIDIRRVIRTE
jgi:cyclophilin family peptidyl-prolyl cis-trans isomerase